MVCELHARLPAGRVGRANCASLNGVTPFHNAQKQPEGLLGVPLSCELDWTTWTALGYKFGWDWFTNSVARLLAPTALAEAATREMRMRSLPCRLIVPAESSSRV